MKSLITIIFILIVSTKSIGQVVTRTSEETTEHFINRIKPDSLKIAHSIIETNTWTNDEKAIVTFFGYREPNNPNIEFDYIYGFVFFPVDKNHYKKISLEQIDGDAGGPEVISVFFANADDDNAKELIVLVKFWQHSLFHMGELYKGFVFDNPEVDKEEITYNQYLLDKLSGCDCDYTEQKSTKAKFKTAQDIKAELKKMGY